MSPKIKVNVTSGVKRQLFMPHKVGASVSYGHMFSFNNFWTTAFVRSMNYEDHWEHTYLLSLPINQGG